MSSLSALVQPVPFPAEYFLERRASVRHDWNVEAVSRPVDEPAQFAWGAHVRDVSAGGLGLLVCFPFKPGSYLAIDMQEQGAYSRTLLARVVHVEDQADGTWSIGCEFVKPLGEHDGDILA